MSMQDRKRPGDGGSVKSAERVLDIFETLAMRLDGMTLSELSRRHGIPKSSTAGLLQTLQRRGYVDVGSNRRYVMTSRLLSYQFRADSLLNLAGIAHPILVELNKATDETVFLAQFLPATNEIIFLDKVVSEQPLRFDLQIGSRRELHSTASGRAFLAALPPDLARQIVDRLTYAPFTEATVTSPDSLWEQVENARRRGYGRQVNERLIGSMAIAVTILGPHAVPIGAVLVAGPVQRMLAEEERVSQLVMAAAARLSEALRGAMHVSLPSDLDVGQG